MRICILIFVVFSGALIACTDAGNNRTLNEQNKSGSDEISTGRLDLQQVSNQLKNQGVEGWFLKPQEKNGFFHFTWLHPKGYLTHLQMKLNSTHPDIRQQMEGLKNKDRVLVKGALIKFNEGHGLEMDVYHLQRTHKAKASPDQDHFTPQLVFDSMSGSEIIGNFKGATKKGRKVFVEVNSSIFSFNNKNPQWVADLFRNDKVLVSYKTLRYGKNWQELEINNDVSHPIEVLDHIRGGNNSRLSLEGHLVYFPETPQLGFDFFALRVKDYDGVMRNYHLINFSDIEVNQKLRNKIAKVWQKYRFSSIHKGEFISNSKIFVRAQGIKRIKATDQCNPQLQIQTLQDVELKYQAH